MNVLKVIGFFSLVFFLVGCGTHSNGALVNSMDAQKNYIHQGSKIAFPEYVSEFKRSDITRFDSLGHDIGVSYVSTDFNNPMLISVFVYPGAKVTSFGSPANVIASAREHLVQAQFQQCKNDLIRKHAGAVLIKKDTTTLYQQGQIHVGQQAIYEYEDIFNSQKMLVISEVRLFTDGDWFVLYRITYPKASNAIATRSITKFMQTLHWSNT